MTMREEDGRSGLALIHLGRMISPDHVRGTMCGASGPFTRWVEHVTCPDCAHALAEETK